MSLCGSVPHRKGPRVGLTGEGRGTGARLGLLPVPNWYHLQISQEALSFSAVRASFQPSRYVSASLCKSLCFHIKTRLHKLTTHSWLCKDSIPSGRASLSRDLPCRRLSFVFIKCCLSKNHYLYLQQSTSDKNGIKRQYTLSFNRKKYLQVLLNCWKFSIGLQELLHSNGGQYRSACSLSSDPLPLLCHINISERSFDL